jgi:hypothetical protein
MATLVTAGMLAACGGGTVLSAADSTVSSLQQAGYRNVGVDLEPGSGPSSDGLVGISFSAGPTGNAQTDAYNAERIAWDTLRYRLRL